MKRLLLSLSGAAVLVAASAVAVNAQHGPKDAENLRQARSAAANVSAPAGARASDACDGDGIVACWDVSRPVPVLADDLTETLATAAGVPATKTCDEVPVGTSGQPSRSDACFVRVRYDGHGVFIFLDPLVERDAKGVATVVGTRVAVQAA